MKKNLFKKSLSVFLAVLMIMSCWVFIPGEHNHVEAVASNVRGVPAIRGSHYAGTTAAYGTPVFDGSLDRWFKFHNKGSDYVKISYPSNIYLDKSETLQSAGYFFNVDWAFGNSSDYRILIGAPALGDNSAYSGYPDKYYTMTNCFNNYGFDSSVPSGGAKKVYNTSTGGTDYDLRIVGYGHSTQGSDGFNYDGTRHDKYVLYRSYSGNPNTATIYLMGTPKGEYDKKEYNTTGASLGSYGFQQNYNGGWKENNNSMFKQKSYDQANDGCSSYYEGQYAEMQWFVTVYDKSALNAVITNANSLLTQKGKYTTASLNNLQNVLNANKGVLTTRATNQKSINEAKDNIQAAIDNLVEFGVAFDNLFNFNEFTIDGNLTVNERTDKGFTVTSTAADGNTGFSKAIPVVPGKTYVLSADVGITAVSGGYDMYIHTLDANQSGETTAVPDTSNGAHREGDVYISLTGQTSNSAPYIRFTAGSNTKFVKIRFDANAPGNKLTVNNIRLLNETDYEGVSYVPTKMFKNNASLGTSFTVPTRTGYTFKRWYADNDVDGMYDSGEEVTDANGSIVSALSTYKIGQNWILHSDWTEHQYNITFNANGGSGSTAGISNVLYSADTKLTANAFSRTGHTFTGWNTKADGTGTAYADGATVSKLTATNGATVTLYAQWSINKHTVAFEKIDGTTTSAQYNYGTAASAITKPANTATKDNGDNHTVYSWPEINDVTGNITYKEIGTTSEHNYGDWVITVYSNCETEGSKYRLCQTCGHKETAAVEKVAHTLVYVGAVPSTCTADGNIEYWYCDDCGKMFSDENGTNEITSVVDAADGHTEEILPAVESTCTATGLTAGKKCSVCGTITVAQQTTDKKAHSMGDWTETTAPTCTAEGQNTRKCANCDYTETEAVEATGHSYTSTVTAPTCTEKGYTTHTCSKCGDTYTDTETAATGHSYGTWASYDATTHRRTCNNCTAYESGTHAFTEDIQPKSGEFHDYACEVCKTRGAKFNGVNTKGAGEACTFEKTTDYKAPTCLEDGYQVYGCSACTNAKTEKLTATDHKWAAATYTWSQTDGVWSCTATRVCENDDRHVQTADSVEVTFEEAQAATCTEMGTTTYTATFTATWAAEQTKDVQDIPANGHTAGAAATCTTAQICTVCDTVLVAALGHKFGETVTANDATCTTAGNYAYKQCTVCNYYFAATETTSSLETREDNSAFVIPALGHEFTKETISENYLKSEADCLNAAEYYKSCSRCGTSSKGQTGEATFTSGNALDHAWSTSYTSNGDGKDNTHYQTCTRENCGAKNTAVKHTWGEGVEDPEAGCENTGTMTYTCTAAGCGATYTETVNADGHTLGDWVDEVPAICNKTGTLGHYECTVCNKYFAEDKTTVIADLTIKIAPENHNWIKGDTVAPTCTAQGYTNYKCSYCDETKKGDYVDSTGHTEATPVIENNVAPTCTATGSYDTVVYCSVCKAELSRAKTTVDALGHAFGDVVEAKDATCTVNGNQAYKQCKTCSKFFAADEGKYSAEAKDSADVFVISAPGHKFDRKNTDTKYLKDEATCISEGVYYYSCFCGEKGKETFETEIDSSNHEKTTSHEETASTCTQNGYTAGVYCEDCKTWISGHEVIPATNHANKVHHEKVDATCIAAGTIEYWACPDCGKNFSDEACKNEVANLTIAIIPANHTELVKTEAKDVTCTVDGNIEYWTCKGCGKIYSDESAITQIDINDIVIPAKGHAFGDVVEAKDATCTVNGNQAYKQCKTCSKFFAANADKTSTEAKDSADAFAIAIVSDAHSWDEGKVTTDPTCTAKGVKTFTCKYDSRHTYTEAIDALDHIDEDGNGYCDRESCKELICNHVGQDTVITDKKDATCLEDGYTGDTRCKKCNVIIEKGEKIAKLGHKDVNKDHACDNGCDVYQGEHADADKNHTCDYGCSVAIGTCEDADKDHDCDYGCDKAYGTCEDTDLDHDCDYGCDKYFGTHADSSDDTDHVCDYGCGAVLEECVDEDKDHACDNGCDAVFGTCEDTDFDHDCDYGCNKTYGEHKDGDKNHTCDYGCKVAIGTCEDADKDHDCDYGCNKTYGEHVDGDKNHTCDYGCKETIGTHADSATDDNHVCDYGCGAVLEECKDKENDGDHNCDVCGKTEITDHEYGEADCEKSATCTECGAETGSALGHSFTNYVSDGNATCLENGTETATCDRCDATDTREDVDSALGHKDDNKDHKCDNDCDVYQGDHVDADKNHTCDYGCAESIGTCEDKDFDHKCDYGCGKTYGEHKDGDKNHTCDYGCSVAIGTCEDADKDHDCDYGCEIYFGEHKDSHDDKDHVCDYCKSGEALEECVDTDKNHACDNGCEIYFGEHKDSSDDKDHVCDYCKSGEALEECVDTDKNHACDNGCEIYFGEHKDSPDDKDHVCDYCKSGEALEECVDTDKNHACDNGCEIYFGEHKDSPYDKDHVCDYCKSGEALEECVDTDKNHTCDNGCEIYFGKHEDTDKNHACDYGCKVAIGTCEDEDLDHKCDYGCDKTYGDHVDTDTDHKCDYGCTDTIGTCADSAEDKDHVCDYGCGKVLEECVDIDKNHACDNGCEINFGKHEDTDKNHACDYGCKVAIGACEDKDLDHKCDYGCDKTYGEHKDSPDDKDHVCDYCKSDDVLENCTDGDDKNHNCDICDKENVSAHKWVDADCTTPKTCSVCDATEGDKLGHNFGEWKTITYATCNSEGEERRDCERCDAYETNILTKLEHTYSATVTEPTCTEKGYTTYTCSCGDSYVSDYVAEKGHSYKSEVTKEPSCEETGIKTFTCSGCLDTYTEIIGMLDHKDENKDGYCDECEEITCKHVETVVVNANPANCEYDGYSGDTVCVQCGKEISKGEIIPKTNHSWGGTPIEIIPATCSDAKTLVYKCRYCQKTENRYEGNPDKEAHTIIVLETIEPTCEKVGYIYYICTLCSTSTEFKVIEAKGHIDEDGDGVCDASDCLKSLKPGVPDGCSCICHSKGFFMQLIYKIVRFFWKLFKISPSCKCGAVHY